MFSRILILLLSTVLFSLPASSQEGTPGRPIRIGFNGGSSPGIIKIKANAFAAFLEERSGLQIKPVIAGSYSLLIRDIGANQVDFAWLSPLGLIKAEEVADAKVLLKAVRSGQPYYWSAVLVRKDSGIRKLGDLKDKRFAFTHLGSTSGYVIPKSSLLKEGIDPDTFFSEVLYAGGHGEVIRMVLDGRVDAGATFADDPRGKIGSWTAEEFLPREEAAKLSTIFLSHPIPGDTFTATGKMYSTHPALVDKVVKAMVEMGNSRPGQTILRDLYNIDSLEEARSKDYDPVREAYKRVFSL
ncbi:MAG: phosphate/phosphite/phosphonate ABC transporter substrate-binding protein [Candidatus Krumholzibacteria bacterium]|nr:phosphate/phosphite/phosphonate ABC transporter substrate-binding protein [Candidatus Krumholzibacteria bacterium]MDP6668999.1 phosphate/phosphite/phosphonate ABC transporter substrate-binding protein [Candidatus Krumholzibacteria bacterium]MDP6797396.1 phosphate/phosphite/phosphonate ABC transporter substrate-binding protein [Candidatus Krumholzibacteria bacterium]MDP7021089.1 phosphate/phosphite/phosphonate ABC transporter substrate-binding protein [Candidatus Krumholzibacteria bacterium]